MSWGSRIVIVYLAFVAGILFLVYKSSLQKTDLVASDYYAKELQYQNVINSTNNADKLSTSASIKEEENVIILSMPSEAINASGKIEFYRPSDASKDFSLPLNIDTNGKQTFNKQRFVHGTYNVKISWSKEGKDYYTEQSLSVN